MSEAKDAILEKIRRSRCDSPSSGDTVISRPRPSNRDGLLPTFSAQLEAAGATVQVIAAPEQIAECVNDYLRREQLPGEVVVSADDIVDVEWPDLMTVHRQRAATGDDKVSVTGAISAVAETGTLVIGSGVGNPTTLNFLPDHHIVVINERQLVANLEDLWPTVRARFPQWPRTVNLISGPSKTADVEQTLQLGAHGPRRLLVIVVRDNG